MCDKINRIGRYLRVSLVVNWLISRENKEIIVKKFIRRIDKSVVREEYRKLGTNLLTASFVGAFITHVADMSLNALVLLVWLAIIGLVFIISSAYQRGE
jgi:hypothetical protein